MLLYSMSHEKTQKFRVQKSIMAEIWLFEDFGKMFDL